MPSPRTEVYEDELNEDVVEVGVEDIVDEDDVCVFLTPTGEFTLRLIDLCARALPLLEDGWGGDHGKGVLAGDIRAVLMPSDSD